MYQAFASMYADELYNASNLFVEKKIEIKNPLLKILP